jgi:predicted nuclease of predicted toxin-antitoxin system
MKIVIDMNLARHWVDMLAPLGIEAVHWSAVGAENTADEDIHAWARDTGHDILTRDHDFANLAVGANAPKPSILLVKAARAGTPATMTFVTSAIAAARTDIERGTILVIDADRRAVRSLSLPRILSQDE